jgi:hypothetical protein
MSTRPCCGDLLDGGVEARAVLGRVVEAAHLREAEADVVLEAGVASLLLAQVEDLVVQVVDRVAVLEAPAPDGHVRLLAPRAVTVLHARARLLQRHGLAVELHLRGALDLLILRGQRLLLGAQARVLLAKDLRRPGLVPIVHGEVVAQVLAVGRLEVATVEPVLERLEKGDDLALELQVALLQRFVRGVSVHRAPAADELAPNHRRKLAAVHDPVAQLLARLDRPLHQLLDEAFEGGTVGDVEPLRHEATRRHRDIRCSGQLHGETPPTRRFRRL